MEYYNYSVLVRALSSIQYYRSVLWHSPMQSTCPGSGSHSLFPVHTDMFGPVSVNPVGHVYVMNCPSIGGLS